MRWLRQRTNWSCVPVAVINILKWAGHRVTHRDLRYWQRRTKQNATGASLANYEKVLRSLPVRMRKSGQPRIPDIDRWLRQDKIVLLRSAWLRGDKVARHVFLLVARSSHHFYCVNLHGTHLWKSKTAVRHWHLQRRGNYPMAWYIERK